MIKRLKLEKNIRFNFPTTIVLLLAMVIIFIFFSLISSGFFTYNNLKDMLTSMSINGVLALGLAPLLLTEGFDISFGANVSMTTVIIAFLYVRGINLWVSIILGIILATFVGFINGILIEKFNLIPIMLTLGIMSIMQAIALLLTEGKTIGVHPDVLYNFGTGSIFKIPFPVILLVILTILVWFILSYTKFGRNIYLIGANTHGAFFSGIQVKKVRIILYTSMGLSVGIASVIMIAITGVGMPYIGSKIPLPVISAVILGGVSMSGGKGTIPGAMLGVVIITIIFNGLANLNVASYFIQIVQGLALIIVVSTYAIRRRRT